MGRKPNPFCPLCGIFQTHENTGSRQHKGQTVLKAYCRSCEARNAREAYQRLKQTPGWVENQRQTKREFYARTCSKPAERERAWRKGIQRRYGISYAEYLEKLDLQKGVCELCEELDFTNMGAHRRLSVDHNHKTGQVRGLLCHRCNLKVGRFESIDHTRIKSYLEKYDG